ncbi:hypothetical protein SAMN02949497_1173 [Methylomagnum ishizawai]|uniref:Uncharacterized protein n=1 Tax=Methylomagnum ishizawai TaxID=1760988 RepID=A0A1Y6CTA5_9GAMM|nr:hypothetical protein [Methylomagnum ishizawai]SMF93879.1 hypothetical protein SAMN02949497_1173 [Methylomagnum ishizawai]
MLIRLFWIPKTGRSGFPAGFAAAIRRHALWGRVARAGLCAALGFLLLVCLLLGLVLQTEPLLELGSQPAQRYFARTRGLIRETVHAGDNSGKTLVLTADDLTAAANFAILRKKLAGRAECRIEGRRLNLTASVRLPFRAFKLFLNLRLIADDAQPQAIIKRLKLGRLSIPAPLTGWLLRGLLHGTPLARYSRVGERLVGQVRIQDDGRLTLVLNWNRDALAQAEGLITDLADKERLLAYHDKLAEVVGQPNLKRFVRLGALFQPLFALAKARSQDDNDPVAENRALIFVLGAYVNGRNLALSPLSAKPLPLGVLLNRRIDTAQHFMGSASIATAGHGTLVDMIGLAKEMNDTHDGSGFSFIDLAADQAGALFGMTAVRSEEKARRFQEVLSQSNDEGLFMPAIRDLPENLSPEAFAARFKEVDSPEFQAMKAGIEARILACPVYR